MAKRPHLVRDGEGKMRTIMANGCRGAINEFLKKYATMSGEQLSVKERGVGDWEDYTVS